MPQPQGRTGVQATYSLGTLRAELPAEVSVMAVAAASEAALLAKGYSIVRRTQSAESAEVVSRRSGDGWLESTTIASWVTATGTAASIRRDPLGDEAESRSIMDEVLVRLGR
ncbi:MAG: DUF3568 family protein [Phycisphaerae bacterium]|nr:DUF3568 family protein [Phycisphaerae bacterium]